jgi:hypothetical protein
LFELRVQIFIHLETGATLLPTQEEDVSGSRLRFARRMHCPRFVFLSPFFEVLWRVFAQVQNASYFFLVI